ncbi:MAG: site-2 protease family protein [Phycisphaerales bacterium]
MFDIPGPLGTLVNFLTIALGFGSIIFVHELGHFLAAKWAGIRVLAFSIGFGQVACSFRKGMGFQAGSSEPKYMQLVRDQNGDHTKLDISPTEYRLSWLPLGGYVKMLGQEDLNPNAVSAAPDSYQMCPIPKRLVVISAGVVVNVITAALLFMLVFSVGLNIMPTKVGQVLPGSPASLAVPADSQYGVGLLPGDTILEVDNKPVAAFRDIATEAAMSSAKRSTPILVMRDGYNQPIQFAADLKPGAALGLLDLGITPIRSTELLLTDNLDLWNMRADDYGLDQVPPGSIINSINSQQVSTTLDIQRIAAESQELVVGYTNPDGESGTAGVRSEQELMIERVVVDETELVIEHVLGLTGLMRVHPDVSASETKQGLMPGDIFIDIAGVEYPSMDDGIRTIRANKGNPIDIKVLRGDRVVELEVQVSDDGRVGFYPGTTTYSSAMVSISSSVANTLRVDFPVGSVIVSMGDQPIHSLDDLVTAIVDQTAGKFDPSSPHQLMKVQYIPAGDIGAQPVDGFITLSGDQLARLHHLPKRWPGGADMSTLFLPVQVIDKADSPVAAVKRGLHESRRIMLQTYLTFLRLTQGSVKVEHLKGPVGIAHIGTLIADEGFIKVLFFMGLISINLAVINFLPLPIVDGGQFLFLIYEWIRGKPIPVGVQNAVTMAGLLLIGTMFILVTFNDIKSLIGF